MASCAVYFAALLFTVALVMTCYGTSIIYLEDYCGRQYYVRKDVRIRLMFATRRSYFDCEMTLRASTGDSLLARFDSYTQGDTNILNSRCDKQAIYLNSIWQNGYCSFIRPTAVYDLSNTATYQYKVDRSNNIFDVKVAQAELYVTEIKYRNSTGGCPRNFFDCEKNNVCIDNDLTCNGNDDCGNDKDETKACGLSTGIIVGIVFGVIGFIVIVAVVVVLVIKCRP